MTLITSYFLYRFQDLLNINSATVQARLEYWEAGLAMGLDSPIFGRGFDYFGESYFLFRSERAAVRSPSLYSDSAHNYFIDLFAFGGFPLLLTVLLPIILVFQRKFVSTFRLRNPLEQNQEAEDVYRGIFLVWLGFLFQAMLSPFSIPLGYLGFLLTGFLFGSLSSFKNWGKPTDLFVKNKITKKPIQTRLISSESMLKFLIVPILIALPILGIQPIIADAKFRDAIEKGQSETLYQIALSQPISFQTMHFASEIFLLNDREDLAAQIISAMVTLNPENIRGWRLLDRVSDTEAERVSTRSKILALDPKNPELQKN